MTVQYGPVLKTNYDWVLENDFLPRCREIGVSTEPRGITSMWKEARVRVFELIRGFPWLAIGLLGVEQRWYASLDAGEPDWGVYDDDLYLAETWACWVAYAKRYIKQLIATGVADQLGEVNSVVDLGCGLGYSTAALKETWPDARVYGTNLLHTKQGRFSENMGRDHDFVMLAASVPADVVFASEYFEHFQAPLEHLHEVVERCQPTTMIIANSFETKAIGHFKEYSMDGVTLSGGQLVTKRFNDEVRSLGFKSVREDGFWNGRPTVWRRESAGPN